MSNQQPQQARSWIKIQAGEYRNGEYTVFRENVNPAYPWAIKRRNVIVDLARTLAQAKTAADADAGRIIHRASSIAPARARR